MTEQPSGRHSWLAWSAVAVAGLVATVVTGCSVFARHTVEDPCTAPTALELAGIVGRSQAVLRGTVQGNRTELDDGTTSTTGGWLVRVDEVLTGAAGAEPGGSIAVWPSIGDGEPATGDTLVMYLATHDGTTADGRDMSGFDSLATLVDHGDDTVSRMCKDSISEPVDRSVVG